LLFVLFYVLFCVNVYCHRVTTQLQLTNMSISISEDEDIKFLRKIINLPDCTVSQTWLKAVSYTINNSWL
jgi:hypothetical protein